MPTKMQNAAPASPSQGMPEAVVIGEQNNLKPIKGWYLWLVQMVQRISGSLPEHVRQSLIDSLNQTAQEDEQANSKKDAVSRLKMVILQDRTNLSPEEMDGLKGDLITTISKYVEVDQETLEIQLEHQLNKFALVANVSMLRVNEAGAVPKATEESAASKITTADLPDEIDDLVEMELAKDAEPQKTKKSS